MSSIKVLTWNSHGDGDGKADALLLILRHLAGQNATPQVIFIQECAAGGPINTLLTQQGYAVTSAAEGGYMGRTYLCAVLNGITITSAFQAYPLSADPSVQSFIHDQPSATIRSAMTLAVANFRSPGSCILTIDGTRVQLVTLHASRGVNEWTDTVSGRADTFAYYMLQQSQFYANLIQEPVGVFAGDLNVQQVAIGSNVQIISGGSFRILGPWAGYGTGLDFVLGHCNNGGTCIGGYSYEEVVTNHVSDHPVVGGEIQWP
jgi:hypothetical protein